MFRSDGQSYVWRTLNVKLPPTVRHEEWFGPGIGNMDQQQALIKTVRSKVRKISHERQLQILSVQ